jgi:CheY-like chemotaxis protein
MHRELLSVMFTTELNIDKRDIHFCNDGAEACTAILENMKKCASPRDSKVQEFSLLILDYHLPYINGLDVIKQCKKEFQKN